MNMETDTNMESKTNMETDTNKGTDPNKETDTNKGTDPKPALRRGISGMTLKRIAALSMLIDHIGAAIVERLLFDDPSLQTLYMALRIIGRLAFPIYCFLAVEGFIHTRSRLKYMRNMAIFMLISDIPFNMAFFDDGSPLSLQYFLNIFLYGHRNVYFTLLFGILALVCISFFCEEDRFDKLLGIPLAIVSTVLIAWLAEYLRTDYGYIGVLTITLMYVLRRWRTLGFAAGVGALTAVQLLEGAAFLDIPFILAYNGQRGWGSKFFHYAFYPGHLLILVIIVSVLGL